MSLSWDTFMEVDMRTGTIIDVQDFPEAKNPAYKLTIDFGVEIGSKRSSAQITSLYTKDELMGKQIVAVINFPKKQIGPFMSECLVLGAVNGKEVTLLAPNKQAKNGLRVS